MINYYDILGIPETASSSEIKAAFKKLAVKYHPDKHLGDNVMEELFKEVNHAYQVLSNPYEKARYDIQLKYSQPHTEDYYTPTSQYSPPKPKPRPSYKGPNYKEPEINWRENWIATAYAFGFTFIMAFLVMGVIMTKRYLDEEAMKELLIERREAFNHARDMYKTGSVDSALTIINALGAFLKTEEDMREYKTDLYESFIYKAETNYNREHYSDAIYYFELLENYGPRSPLPIQEHQAIAYRKANEPEKCIKKLKELLIANYRRMETYIELAEIYRYDLKDLDESERYYEVASDLAIEKYETIYGDAYPLVLKGEFLPSSHYYLYTGLASIYLENGDPELAVKATRWNTIIWPDSVDNFVIAALGLERMGEHEKACETLSVARSLGFKEPLTIDCP